MLALGNTKGHHDSLPHGKLDSKTTRREKTSTNTSSACGKIHTLSNLAGSNSSEFQNPRQNQVSVRFFIGYPSLRKSTSTKSQTPFQVPERTSVRFFIGYPSLRKLTSTKSQTPSQRGTSVRFFTGYPSLRNSTPTMLSKPRLGLALN